MKQTAVLLILCLTVFLASCNRNKGDDAEEPQQKKMVARASVVRPPVTRIQPGNEKPKVKISADDDDDMILSDKYSEEPNFWHSVAHEIVNSKGNVREGVVEKKGNTLVHGGLTLDFKKEILSQTEAERNIIDVNHVLRFLESVKSQSDQGTSILAKDVMNTLNINALKFMQQQDATNTLNGDWIQWLFNLFKNAGNEGAGKGNTLEAHSANFGFFKANVYDLVKLRAKESQELKEYQESHTTKRVCGHKCYLNSDNSVKPSVDGNNPVFLGSYVRALEGVISEDSVRVLEGDVIGEGEKEVNAANENAWVGIDAGGKYIRGRIEVGASSTDEKAFESVCVRKEYLKDNGLNAIGEILSRFQSIIKGQLSVTDFHRISTLARKEVETVLAFAKSASNKSDKLLEQKLVDYEKENPNFKPFVEDRNKQLKNFSKTLRQEYGTMAGKMYYIYESSKDCKCQQLSYYTKANGNSGYTQDQIENREAQLQGWCEKSVQIFKKYLQ